MLVTSQCKGYRVTGLYVGASNVRRYFPKRMTEIELQLDHLRIECELASQFWQDMPEIHDSRLCAWLESKLRDPNGIRGPVSLSMIPSGKNLFIVGPASMEQSSPRRVSNSVSSGRPPASVYVHDREVLAPVHQAAD
jgi:hypothetical protein